MHPQTNRGSCAANGVAADHVVDISRDTCPMTFVRTRLALDRMAVGETLLVILRGDEPRRNVPASARELGHVVLRETERPDGTSEIVIRRC